MAAAGGSFCHRCGASIGPGAYFCPRCGTSIAVASRDAGANVATASGRPHDAEWDAVLDALRQATLGEYEILGELGRGGMATVYLGHDLALDRKVAIKVLAPALLLMGEGMVERFKREARTAAALNHPHIIPIYAVKESERVLYFIMQYVPGRALDSIIRDVGPLPIPMVQTILAHVGDALSYAHRHGVIHRDIKSANIMLDEEGWALVTDFGIAKVALAEGLTMTGVTVGTPTYMSPEQCGCLELSGASDQYSLGVVAYELLAGRPPFQGESIMSVMYAHVNERPRPVTDLRSDCPPGLGAAVMRMLEKDAARRWPSLDDMVAVCGRPSLRHDDPVRSEMITLAKSGGRLAEMKTPTSPIPPAKPQTRPSAAPVPRTGRGTRLWWGAVAVALVLGLVLWRVAPWRLLSPPPALRDTVFVSQPVRGAADTAAVRPPPDAAAARAPRQRERLAAPPPAAVIESLSRAGAAQREDSLVRSLRAMALAAMRRALERGATPADMAKGDTVFKGAESLAAQGRLSEAIVQLATAGSLWGDAERASGSRAARDTARRRAAEPPAPAVEARASADPRPQIALVISDYARALESLDLIQVRRAYPGLTSGQQRGWKDFFESVRKLKATLAVTALSVTGASAEAIVGGVYEYEGAATGRAERLPVTFRAVLVADSTGWRITAIR